MSKAVSHLGQSGLPDWQEYEVSGTRDSNGWRDRIGNPRDIDRCPHCTKSSKLDIESSSAIGSSQIQRMSGSPPTGPFIQLQIWQCRICEEYLVEIIEFEEAKGTTTSDLYRAPVADRFVWPVPVPRTVPEFVPKEIESFYSEASVAEAAGAYRGAAVLYRSTAEAIVNERGCTGRDLFAKINDLGGLGVPPDLVEDLHEARVLGDYSVHEGVAFSREEVEDVAALLYEAMEDLYTTPQRHSLNKESRAARRSSGTTT